MTEEIPPDFGELQPLAIGLILDYSLRHHADSRRLIDVAKEQLVAAVSGLETDDKVYVCHPSCEMMPRWRGKAIGLIADYKMPPAFNPAVAIRTTLDALGGVDARRKILFYITDRACLKPSFGVESALRVNQVRNYDVESILMCVGDGYDAGVKDLQFRFVFVERTDELAGTITDIMKEDSGDYSGEVVEDQAG